MLNDIPTNNIHKNNNVQDNNNVQYSNEKNISPQNNINYFKNNIEINNILKKYDIDKDDPLLAFIEMEHSILNSFISEHNYLHKKNNRVNDLDFYKSEIEKLLNDFKLSFFLKSEENINLINELLANQRKQILKDVDIKLNDIDIDILSSNINKNISTKSDFNILLHFLFFSLGVFSSFIGYFFFL
jgi:hypothetical protein